MTYNKLLLDELRLGIYEKGSFDLTDERMAQAVTLNENLQALGYLLSPTDMVSLAVSPSLEGFYDQIKGMMDTVDAQPMYPGFPLQVMEMDEAVFRFHQMVHYFSTYGLEFLFGVNVQKGWLPCEEEKSADPKEQKTVLNVKILRLLPEEERFLAPLQTILLRKERMTMPEREIVTQAIPHISAEQIQGLKVGFKENLNALYEIIFEMEDRKAAFRLLHVLCQHTGDVLRCVDRLLRKHRFHFRTIQKRFLVKLLESYPAKDFRANLILSGKSAEKNLLLLNYLDYSVYSRSQEHQNAVNDLRDGALRSWESIAKSMLESGSPGTLDFISQRPGMMLRMMAWLMRKGYSKDAVVGKLREKASSLSVQTLVINLNYFGKLTRGECEDAETLYLAFEELLKERLKSSDTPLRGKKVRIRMDEYDLAASEVRCSDKSAEGGYIRSGIAYRIPQEVRFLRFFVYWNDSVRVDVDLHAGFTDPDGRPHGVGWNQQFRDCGVVFSGDITHSDAAEFIDVDLAAPIEKVHANIHLYSGKDHFGKIETCYVGMMAVPDGSSDGQETALYKDANCFFRHHLRQACQLLNYGYIDVPNRCLIFDGTPQNWDADWYRGIRHRRGRFSLARYLVLLLEAQRARVCSGEEEADLVLVMGKPESEKEVSLLDANFFMETV